MDFQKKRGQNAENARFALVNQSLSKLAELATFCSESLNKVYFCDIIENSNAERRRKMIFETVRDIIANQLGLDNSKITPDSDIVNDLGLDSLDVVELVMTIEDEFDLVADDDAVATLKTVGDVVKYIEENK